MPALEYIVLAALVADHLGLHPGQIPRHCNQVGSAAAAAAAKDLEGSVFAVLAGGSSCFVLKPPMPGFHSLVGKTATAGGFDKGSAGAVDHTALELDTPGAGSAADAAGSSDSSPDAGEEHGTTVCSPALS